MKMRATRIVASGWFPAFWLFIGVVSAIDTYLIIRFKDLMWHVEQNPIGRYLIKLDDGNVTVFIRTKLAGTVVVMAVLAGLYVYRRRWSFPVTASVASFQFGLLLYFITSAPLVQREAISDLEKGAVSTGNPRTLWDDIAAILPASGWEPPCESVWME